MTSTSSSQPPELRYIKPIPVLRCHNVEDSLLWWTRLGFKIGGKHDGFLSVAAGDKAIVNLYMREPSAESFPVGLGEIIILLDTGEVAKLFAFIQAQKLELSYAPHGGERCEPKPWGFEQFSLLDPSGNKITFASHLTEDEEEPEVQAPSVPEL